ncbi:MAG: amidohydrolase family protein [Acetobacteraceae bacterium]|nr:amidohydrolase family protein [Acetobacteraceae bacterium]
MPSRRGLLGAGLAFCSCCLLDRARAQPAHQQAPARRPVSIGGQRVKTVDVHSHCIFQDALSLMGAAGQNIVPPTKGVAEHFLANGVDDRLRSMDDMGVDMEILSINPFWYRTDRDTGSRIVALQNDHLAELCAANPDRFGAFASLTMQFPDLAVKQLEDAMRKPGIRGAAIGGSVLGESFAEPRFRPLLAKAEELGAVLFIHPQALPEMAPRFVGNGWIANTVGNPLETTIALEHLIFEGALDRFPKLKILAAHGGGFLPSYAPRIDVSCSVSPQNCNPGIVLKKKPTEYLNQMFYDALVFTPEALRHLAAQVGTSQIVLGTDFPIPWELHPVDLVLATPSLSDPERVAILGGNAARLFGLPA